jgi:ABC-type glycerol-3-phosphate transport system substrate-binding protein
LLSLVDVWNRDNPEGVVVAPERHDLADLHAGVLSGAARNALPSLLLVSPSQAAVYYRRGILASLDSYMTNSNAAIGWSASDRSDLYPFIFAAGRTAGANSVTIGIPFGGVARVMFANLDWLQSININTMPADWEQFDTACAGATDRSRGTLCFGADTSSAVFEEWLYAHGGSLIAQDAEAMQLQTPAAADALGRLSAHLGNNQAYRVNSQRQSRDDFTAGRVIFAFDWSDQAKLYRDLIRERANFAWGIGVLPATQPEQATAFRAPLWVVAKTDEARQLAAWRFIRWLTDAPQTAEWAMKTGELPARVSAISWMAGQESAEPWQAALLKTIAPTARPEPLVGGWGCIQGVLASSLRQVFDGQPVTDTLQVAQFTAQNEIDFDCSLQ